ncbi:LysR family transcriptional regulator [Shewanella psychropiezotolerans]|uniref:LysR family transcriptional regulator n=1 Tax=Shewanella psychropiezotolerans TaxID=2593655 RepID=A0ABX5X3K3_9GAMM|nr:MULTISPECIES: LysR family transcriptional regulator [Shewanella]MPY21332.1 LysR family transcriptional regulator [Shewanella sp. YLB-07]MPY22119.1 LysR family transcriptional regulator [Shewanella sp. YLB-07]QDO85027.1 LysR family transcriptional regulator [Shewanella psychropiezotolerans]
MDRFTAMRSFVEVANTASFTQAADNLSLSRLQVSRHVQDLESWLKLRLLHRTTRKVSLTHAGEAALKRCERILDETAALEFEALSQADKLSGTIRITAPIGLSQNMLIDLVEDFTELHPLVNIDIFASDTYSQLVDERIDIALRYTQQPDESLIARKLFSIDSVLCASEEYLKLHGEPVSPAELTKHNCLVHLGMSEWRFIRDNQQFSVEVKGNIQGNDVGLLLRSAIRGKGVVRLPCDLANPIIAAKQLQPILLDYYFPSSPLWAVYLSRSYQLPLVRQFIDFIAEQWQQDIKRLEPVD